MPAGSSLNVKKVACQARNRTPHVKMVAWQARNRTPHVKMGVWKARDRAPHVKKVVWDARHPHPPWLGPVSVSVRAGHNRVNYSLGPPLGAQPPT